MGKRLSAAVTAMVMGVSSLYITADAADNKDRSVFYNSATLLGLDEDGNKTGFSSITDITGVSAVIFTFKVDEELAQAAAAGDIDFTGTLGTDSDTLGLVSHEWSFVPYLLDENGEVVYDDDLMPVKASELTMEKVMDGFYTVTLENPTGFFKDEDTYAKLWFDCSSDEYEISLTGVVLSFDDSKIVRNLSNAKASLSVSSYYYTGSAIKPSPKVTYGSKTLKEGTDYTLSYKNNTNAGTATVTATGKGKYKGTVSKTFTITKRNLNAGALTIPKNSYVYKGKAIKPAPTVKVDGKTLVKGTDYTVSYSANTDIGTATVKVTGKGNYTGTLSKTFGITPKATTIKSAACAKTTQATVKWAKNTTADGYQIAYSTSSSFSSYKTKGVSGATKVSAKISSLTKGKTYYFKVRAYKTVNGKKIYGPYSAVKSVKIK